MLCAAIKAIARKEMSGGGGGGGQTCLCIYARPLLCIVMVIANSGPGEGGGGGRIRMDCDMVIVWYIWFRSWGEIAPPPPPPLPLLRSYAEAVTCFLFQLLLFSCTGRVGGRGGVLEHPLDTPPV